jgi:hypothetical protein
VIQAMALLPNQFANHEAPHDHTNSENIAENPYISFAFYPH